MITLILDGYNVIHGVVELERRLDRSLEAARAALVDMCQAYKARRGDVGRVYVVFDGDDAVGAGGSAERGGVSVVFTRKREEADDRILGLIRADAGQSRFVIVSNDTYVFNNARAQGARVMSVGEFYAQSKPPAGAVRSAPRAAGDEKSPLPSREAQRITDDYRRRLEKPAA